MNAKSPIKLIITRRAIEHMLEIEAYSIEQWGVAVAERYLTKLKSTLELIRRMPSILRNEPSLPKELKVHLSERHLLIFAETQAGLHLMAVFHGSTNLPQHSHDLMSTFASEVEASQQKVDES